MKGLKNAYEGSEPYVFVSYAHKDSALVHPLVRGMQDRGLRVWYDAGLEVGDDWLRKVADQLKNCCCLIAFVSENYDASENCRREINFAIKLHKNPVVTYLADDERLSADMQMQLCTLHAIYFKNYRTEDEFLDILMSASVFRPCISGLVTYSQAGQQAAENEPMDGIAQKDEMETQECSECGDEESSGTHDGGIQPIKPCDEVLLDEDAQTIDVDGEESTVGALITHVQPEETLAVVYRQAEKLYDARQYERAAKLFKKAAEKGHPKAQYRLGCCYRTGSGVKKISSVGVQWYQKAAEQGHGEACYALAECYERGIGGLNGIEEALAWYQKAVELGIPAEENVERCAEKIRKREEKEDSLDAEMLFEKALEHLRNKRYKDAIRLLEKAAIYRYAKALLELGDCYCYGLGVEVDRAKAIAFYKDAADQDEAEAKYKIGDCFWPEMETEAIGWYRAAAEQGHSGACSKLGYIYEKGYGVRRDVWEALKWYQKSKFYGSKIVDDDICRCDILVKAEAEALADKALSLYKEGEYEKSVTMFRMAAERGNTYAHFGLGECYFYGNGVQQSFAEALKWYSSASERGYEDAAQMVKKCKWKIFWNK